MAVLESPDELIKRLSRTAIERREAPPNNNIVILLEKISKPVRLYKKRCFKMLQKMAPFPVKTFENHYINQRTSGSACARKIGGSN